MTCKQFSHFRVMRKCFIFKICNFLYFCWIGKAPLAEYCNFYSMIIWMVWWRHFYEFSIADGRVARSGGMNICNIIPLPTNIIFISSCKDRQPNFQCRKFRTLKPTLCLLFFFSSNQANRWNLVKYIINEEPFVFIPRVGTLNIFWPFGFG